MMGTVMDVEAGRDLYFWLDWCAAVAANLTVFGGGFFGLWKGLHRLKQIADASVKRANAVMRLAETQEAELTLSATNAEVGEGETPIIAARRLRASIIFDAYLEWRDAAHYANGGIFKGAEIRRYLDWLRQALLRLEVVLVEGARGGLEQHWEERTRQELKPHRWGLNQLDPNEFENGSLRELIRGN
jgi:hypothetical protein